MFPLKDTSTSRHFPFWVIVLIAINLFVFYLELTAADPEGFISAYAMIPGRVDPGNLSSYAQFFTSQFLHGGFLHIISNMWFLWIFGDNVEDRFGFLFFPALYLLSGLAGNVLQYFFSPDSGIPVIGASGAIAGVLGAYYALFPHNRIKTLVFILFFVSIIDIPASLMLFYWFALQLFSGAASVAPTAGEALGGVAYFAHVGGFAAGWFVGKLGFRQ